MPHPHSSYVVCATPRSGSTLLCEALRNTGVAGRPAEYFEALRHSGLPRRPDEYFTAPDAPDVGELLGHDRHSSVDDLPRREQIGADVYARYLDEVLELGTTPNGVFGAKLMWGYVDDFAWLARQVPAYRDLPLAELLPAIFPRVRYVSVTRQDKVRQAVSLWKAIQTSAWADEGVEEETGRPRHLPVYDAAAIGYLLRRAEEHEAAWRRFFVEAGVEPIRVVYEELAERYEETALAVLEALGIEPPAEATFQERRLRRQADDLSEDWAERFRREQLAVA